MEPYGTPANNRSTWRLRSKKASPERLAFLFEAGAGKRSRTPDLRITNALLYQLSYAG